MAALADMAMKPALEVIGGSGKVPLGGRSVVLVHDYLLVMRGAERTFDAMAELWPEAPIATLLYDPATFGERFAGRDVRTSFLQASRARQRNFRALLPLCSMAAERLRVSDFDVVVSSSSAFAHGVRPGPGGMQISYCHSPFRYAWFERERGRRSAPLPLRPALSAMLSHCRTWTTEAAGRVTHFVANSRLTQHRIREAWGRDSEIIHPPVDVDRFHSREPEDFLLLVGEVTTHKRRDLALEAARLARMPIVVVGDGPDLQRLRARYGDTATFTGRLDDCDLAELYSRAAGLVVPNVEEFGIVAVEAMAAGRPVVAINAGGTQETVVHGETGLLVDEQTPQAFAAALRELPTAGFDRTAIARHAQRFSRQRFQRELSEYVEAAVSGHVAATVPAAIAC